MEQRFNIDEEFIKRLNDNNECITEINMIGLEIQILNTKIESVITKLEHIKNKAYTSDDESRIAQLDKSISYLNKAKMLDSELFKAAETLIK